MASATRCPVCWDIWIQHTNHTSIYRRVASVLHTTAPMMYTAYYVVYVTIACYLRHIARHDFINQLTIHKPLKTAITMISHELRRRVCPIVRLLLVQHLSQQSKAFHLSRK
jgi:hypothetical protein